MLGVIKIKKFPLAYRKMGSFFRINEHKKGKTKQKGGNKMYNFRTDLADERSDLYRKANQLEQIDGIETTQEQMGDKLKVTRVKITNEKGEEAIR